MGSEALKKGGDYASQLALMLEVTKIQAADPYGDRLSARAMPVIEQYKQLWRGTFLDVGCYGGWVYPHVKDIVEYHGIDNWGVAIDAAKTLFGDHFEKIDVRDYKKKHDIVFASQLAPETDELEILEHLKSLANKMLIVRGLLGTDEVRTLVLEW